MRASLEELALDNLRQVLPEYSLYYESREAAYETLKRLSGLDFGYDVDAWAKWVRDDNERKLAKIRTEMESFGIKAVDGMIDTSSQEYKQFEAERRKRTDALLKKHGMGNLFKKDDKD